MTSEPFLSKGTTEPCGCEKQGINAIKKIEEEHSSACCVQFATYFAGKIYHIPSELDSGLLSQT